ncbi:MAG: transcriptional regulator [Clostridium sp.]|uniref:transcriptional regulator n=1 Tax=Clostridium sp. TaxID=1506 RepID=UPI0039EAF977
MLMKVLKKLSEGGRYSSSRAIAADLGIDVGMVEQILLQLKQLGFIQKDTMDASSTCTCSKCDTSKSSCCSSNVEIGMWSITEKGRNAISQRA